MRALSITDMDRIFFEEKQKLTRAITWTVFFVGLACCSPIIRGAYIRGVLHEPWGDTSMSDLEVFLLLTFILAMVGLMFWIISSVYLEIVIDQTGIWYRSFPQHWKRRRIEKASITAYLVRKIRWNEMIQGRSNKIQRSKGNGIFHIRGDKVLELTLSGGEKLIVGTQEAESVIWAMGKLMSNS